MGSMSACAVTENPSTYSYERGNSEKPDWTMSGVHPTKRITLGTSQEAASGLTSIPPGTVKLVEQLGG
jgi:hypothetical protein